ncbi:MAG: cell division protein ZapB [Deltaproteobacteria bacterium]|nr:MAG: cell division protein ZapB [Deltaproteobacteria bacterium]
MGLKEIEQFELLEQRVETLISALGSLNEQKMMLERKARTQEEELGTLRSEIDTLRADRDVVQKRIAGLLEKIAECEV